MPSANINVAGTYHSSIPWINVGGTWRQAQQIWQNVAGTWRKVYQLVLVSLSNASPSVSRTTTGTATVSTTATGTDSGGTYAWTLVSGGTGITLTGSATSIGTWSGTVSPSILLLSGVYKCTYTIGGFSASVNASVSLHYTGTGL